MVNARDVQATLAARLLWHLAALTAQVAHQLTKPEAFSVGDFAPAHAIGTVFQQAGERISKLKVFAHDSLCHTECDGDLAIPHPLSWFELYAFRSILTVLRQRKRFSGSKTVDQISRSFFVSNDLKCMVNQTFVRFSFPYAAHAVRVVFFSSQRP
jgi:hypothetical protein